MPEQDQTETAAVEAADATPRKAKLSLKFSVAVCLLVLLSMCVFWLISSYHTRNVLQQQADRLGPTLARQTAMQLTELVLANDLISINVVLGNLTHDSAIAEIAVLNIDNEVMAIASNAMAVPVPVIPLPFDLAGLQNEYTAEVAVSDSTAGHVRLSLDLSHIETTLINNLLFVIAATLVLLVLAAVLTNTYFQYLVVFPARLLSFALSNIRKGEIETCPEPKNDNELSGAIRQFNATAEFLAQNTFLYNIGRGIPESDKDIFETQPGRQTVTLLVIKMSNFQYLASTRSEEVIVNLLNKYYFFAGKVSQLYSGQVAYCSEEEVIINFGGVAMAEEQAFYAICAGQLFMQLLGDLCDVEGIQVPAKFRLAVHSGQAVGGLYSPITHETSNLTGKTLDLARQICDESPDNALLISGPACAEAGGESRVEVEVYSEGEDEFTLSTYLALAPIAEYRMLLERQAIQLVTLYSD
ncbi:MAG: hypothetical protein MI673_08345 [Thiotrichales bacterium]|nr:hypothetical protein [Thiotrichales bacterium]